MVIIKKVSQLDYKCYHYKHCYIVILKKNYALSLYALHIAVADEVR